MQAMQFEQSVQRILGRDRRFDPQAYFFVKEALDFTLQRVAGGNGGQARHVSGQELLEGFRDCALEQFGPMASARLPAAATVCYLNLFDTQDRVVSGAHLVI